MLVGGPGISGETGNGGDRVRYNIVLVTYTVLQLNLTTPTSLLDTVLHVILTFNPTDSHPPRTILRYINARLFFKLHLLIVLFLYYCFLLNVQCYAPKSTFLVCKN